MKKTLFFLLFSFVPFFGFTQNFMGGFAPIMGLSCWQPTNTLTEKFEMGKSFSLAGNMGFEFEMQMGKLRIFVEISGESSEFKNTQSSLSVRSTLSSLNAAYPLFSISSKRSVLLLRAGIGCYNSDIVYGRNNSEVLDFAHLQLPQNLVVNQRYNIYIPIGLVWLWEQSERHHLKVGLYYRTSLENGTQKVFGNHNQTKNFPIYKLNGLVMGVSYAIYM